MDRLTFACFCIFLVVGMYDGVAASKPTMIPAGDEIVIQEGDELKISCKGVGPIHFSAMEISGQNAPSSKVEVDKSSGVYTFTVPKMRRSDAGWYACAEEGIEIRNDEQTIEHPTEDISWIYVYVNASKPFADYRFGCKRITRLPRSSVVIPCRPTLPGMPMPNLTMMYGRDVDLIRSGFRFDPKIGFIKADAGNFSTTDYTCTLARFEGCSRGRVKYVVEIGNFAMAPPIIDEDKLRHLVWGQSQTLRCRITDETHNPESDEYTLEWKAPESVPEERLRREYPTRTEAVLTIVNVQESDSGKYTCIVDGNKFDANSTSVDIQFYDPSTIYVNVTTIKEPGILKEGETAVWALEIDTNSELEIKWLKEDNEEITSNGKYGHFWSEKRHQFHIFDVNTSDSGNYKVKIVTATETLDHILKLKVLGKKSNIDNKPFFYRKI